MAVKSEIIEGLKHAVERGYSLETAVASFINAGYNSQDVHDSARAITGGAPIPKISSPLSPLNPIQQPRINQQLPQPKQIAQSIKQEIQKTSLIQQDIPKPANQQIQQPIQHQPQIPVQQPIQYVQSIHKEKGSGHKIAVILLSILLLILLSLLFAIVFAQDAVMNFLKNFGIG